MTYVLESWPVRWRNRASGFIISGYAGGTVLAAELYTWVVPRGGWRWMFWIDVLPVLVALWMRRSLPEAGDWQQQIGAAGTEAERPNPFRPLFTGRIRPWANAALTVTASVALFCVFTPVGAGFVPGLSVVAAGCLVAFAVQLGGRRGWLLYVALTATVFCAFLYSWPIQALLPTYLKTDLGYAPAQVADVMFYAGFGTMAGCWLAGFVGDRIGTRRAYACTLLASLAFVFPVFAVQDSLPVLGVLVFGLLALSQGISGILPKYLAGHFPTATRAASLGFVYNVGALGGAVAPVLGAHLAEGMSLGQALAVLTFGLTLVVIILVGGDVPRRLGRLVGRQAPGDHLVPGAEGAGAPPAGSRPLPAPEGLRRTRRSGARVPRSARRPALRGPLSVVAVSVECVGRPARDGAWRRAVSRAVPYGGRMWRSAWRRRRVRRRCGSGCARSRSGFPGPRRSSPGGRASSRSTRRSSSSSASTTAAIRSGSR